MRYLNLRLGRKGSGRVRFGYVRSLGCALILATVTAMDANAVDPPAAPAVDLPTAPTSPQAQPAYGEAGFDPLKTKSKVTCVTSAPSHAAKSVRYSNSAELFETSAYSTAATVPARSKLVFLSGQIPVDRSFEVVGKDLFEQTQAALRNLCHAMQASHVSLRDVVKIGVTYVHGAPTDPFIISQQLNSFFGRDEMPATTMMGVSYLIAENIRVQIEATAVID